MAYLTVIIRYTIIKFLHIEALQDNNLTEHYFSTFNF